MSEATDPNAPDASDPTGEEIKAKSREIRAEARAVLGDRLTPETLEIWLALGWAKETLKHERTMRFLKYASAGLDDSDELLKVVVPLALRAEGFSKKKRGRNDMNEKFEWIIKHGGAKLPSRAIIKQAGYTVESTKDGDDVINYVDNDGRKKTVTVRQAEKNIINIKNDAAPARKKLH